MKEQTPKDLLAGQELIGFARRKQGNDQAIQRASSAKVYLKSLQRTEAERVAVAGLPRSDKD